MVGKNPKQDVIYLIDFGSTISIRGQQTVHRSNRTGTPRYASIGTHKMESIRNKKKKKKIKVGGQECNRNLQIFKKKKFPTAASPKDDLESLGYMLVEMTFGKLPWGGLDYNSNNVWDVIKDVKIRSTIKQICTSNSNQTNRKFKFVVINYYYY